MTAAPYRVRLMTNLQGGFYELVGPVLGRREIVKELGHPVWDDDGKVWSIAIAKGNLVGCVGITAGKVSSLYVMPDWRRQGLASRLLDRAITTGSAETYQATVTPAARRVFETVGFRKVGERGCYTLMERP